MCINVTCLVTPSKTDLLYREVLEMNGFRLVTEQLVEYAFTYNTATAAIHFLLCSCLATPLTASLEFTITVITVRRAGPQALARRRSATF